MKFVDSVKFLYEYAKYLIICLETVLSVSTQLFWASYSESKGREYFFCISLSNAW